MRGTHRARIWNRRVDYRLELRRNVTVIAGDSGTGKTTLFDMVADHARLGPDSGVQVECDAACTVLNGVAWKAQLEATDDSIVFIDEGAPFVGTEEFAHAIRGTGNYYVVLSREPLHQLAYSVSEIYSFKTSGKYHTLQRLYEPHGNHAYGTPASPTAGDYDALLTEDSKAGYEFYRARFEGTGVSCATAGSKSAVAAWLKDHAQGRVFVVADGAGFGDEAERVLKYQREHAERVTVCLPESFEWLILRSGLVKRDGLKDMLADPGASIESAAYSSWERFFTDYLVQSTKGTPLAYSKARLADAYTLEKNADRVMALIESGNIH